MSCEPNTLAESARCFCGFSAEALLEIQTYLLCQIVESGIAGGGSSQMLSGTDAPPVASPTDPANPAMYYQVDVGGNPTGTVYGWNTISQSWGPIIAP